MNAKLKLKFSSKKTKTSVQREHYWAKKIVKIQGGWLAFESVSDWRAWLKDR